MNANCYRVIFNKARGMLMVVSEAARSQGKTNNPASTGSDISQVAAGSQTSVTAQSGKLDTLRSHLLLALGLASIVGVSNISHADNTKIIADQAAAKNQQATILNSANGTTQVNIQTPSKAGVSRNVFSQFDVGQDGAILNNSRINTQTQMAGWVDGNPWLARGEAKVILNEVNSSDPSKLNGFTEIAGRRAELVIANPAGITCAGCGFINASRTILTTGEAMMKEGKLTGFNVKEGILRVDGTGMNTGDSDYTQLISKTAQINANIAARNLDVITGSNQVSYEDNPENTKVSNTSGSTTNSQTGVALDVSSLGGMYAGKIRLIGTDKGMGVTNAGSINTSGSLSLDANGNLVNSGSLTANQGQVDIDVNNNQINNSGTIASSRNQLNLSSDGLDNTGVISSYDTAKLQQVANIKNLGKDAEIRAGSFDLTATSLTNTGKLLQTGTGKLSIAATNLANRDKAIIGQDLYPKADADPSKPEVIAPTTPPSSANNGSVINNSDDTPADGQPNTPVEPLPTITKDGSIKVDTLSNTQSGSVYANGKMDIQANTVSNTGQSSIGVSSLKLDANGSAINNDSRIQLDAVNWKLANFDNSKGQIIANGGINIDSNSDIKNAEGSLASAADINLATTKDIDNHSGIIQSTDLNVVSKNFNNSEGNINAQGTINIDSSGNLINNKGSISSTKDAHINSDILNNDKGVINSQASLTTHSTSLDNSGQIYSKDQTSITSKDAITNSGTIASAGNANISAGSLTQTGSGSLVAGMDTEGKLIEGNTSNLTVNTTGNLVSQGQHIATGNVSLTGADVNLEDSTTQGQGITTKATTGSVNTKKASIAATDTLSLHSEGTLDNTQGNLSGKVLDIIASALNNTDGKLTQTGSKDLTLKMLKGINNSRGEIASNSNNLTIVTSGLDNSDGKIVHAGSATTNDNKSNKHTLNITASKVNNTKGQVLSLGDQTWKVSGDINNTQGVVQASRFDISASALDNTDGRIQAVNPVQSQPDTQAQPEDTSSRLNISGNITNSISEEDSTGGVIANNTGALDINAKQLVNDNAKISSLGSLSIDSDNLSNSGNVYTEDNLIIANAKHVNNSGSIASQGNTSLNTESFTQNNKGRMIAGLTFEGELSDNNANLTVFSDDKQINSGTNIATGDINLTGSALDLTDSHNQSDNLTLTAKAGDITLDAASTNVSQKASFITTSKFSNDSGVLQAGEFDWQVNELSNVAGSINQTGAKDFTLITTGNINNQQGVIGGTANRLTVHSDDKLNNRTGKIVHNGSDNADIRAFSIDNTEGTIISNNALTVKASKNIDNTQGGIQGDALNVQSQSINNDNGKLISLTGDLQLNSDLVTNQGKNAFIQSGKDLKVNSQRLDNKQSATLWANGSANVSATDSLTNLSGATIASDKQLVIKAGTLTNDAKISSISNEVVLNSDGLNNLSQGQITGATNNVITTRQALNNQGVIGATDKLDINSGAIDNNQGVLSAAEVILNSRSDINNNDGLIAQTSQDKALNITAKGSIQNQNTKVEADQQNAANQKGILANGSANISAGGLDNQSGHIAVDTIEVNLTSADSINNAQGQIQATKGVNLTANNSALLNNQGGQIVADTVDLTVGNTDKGRIDNNTADSLIQGGSKVNITTGIVDNQNTKQVGGDKTQGIIAGDTININTSSVNNKNGQVLTDGNNQPEQTQANDTIAINASSKVNNQSGIIQSQNIGITDNSTTSRSLVLNNDSGRIAANQNVALVAKGFSNQGGEILANGRADVNVIDDIRYTGTNSINANEVALTTKGDFINTGVLSGQNALTINASTIDNQKDSELSSQGTTQLIATSNIDNRGLINGSNTYLKADDSVGNYSHGRIYGDHLAIEANTLNNTPDKFSKVAVDECEAGPGCAVEYAKSQLPPQFITDLLEDEEIDSEIKDILKAPYDDSLTKYYKVSSEPAPVIAARERLDIGVQTLNNNPNQARAGIFNSDFNGQAKILSNGELHIGGGLDTNHHAIGKANTVTNKGASIESVGGMSISADTLNNVNADFDYNLLKTDEQQVMDFLAGGKIYTSDEAYIQLGGWNDHWHKVLVTPEGDTNYGLWVDDERRSYLQRFYTNKVYTATTVSSDPSLIRSGGNTKLNINKAINDNSIIVDAKTLTLSNYTVGPNSGNVDNQSTMGIELTEKANASAINYNTKGKKRNPLSSKRPYTKKSNIDNYSIPTELAETYELPILNQDIDKAVIAYKDGNISDVKSLDSIKTAIETLAQDKQTAVGQPENPSVNKTGTEDALKLLEGFVKADNSKLTDVQKQQLQALLNAQKNGKDIDNAAVQDLIDSLNDTIAQSASEEIRSSNNTPTLPNISLYAINPDSSADYLIETDPAFADYKKWLSSDYMMQRLKLDPSVTHKRLGDGYYEQQLIRDQIMALTGRYYLGDYRSNDEQYKGLMDAGITAAKALNLRPGIALTAEQVANLTTDIVWIEEQTITLADGSTQKALVPKVYTRQAVGQIDGTGSLIAANNLVVNVTGNVTNQGLLVGRNNAYIKSLNLTNESGGVIAGDYLQLNTANDLTNKSLIKAGSAANLEVGGNFNNQSDTYSTSSTKGLSSGSRTDISQLATIYVGDTLKGQTDKQGNPLITFNANVGGNTTFDAGVLDNQGGSTRINTAGNTNLNAVNTGYQTNAIGDANNYFKQGETRDIGSQITGTDNIIITSGGNFTGKAVSITSDNGTVGLQAGNDITLTEGRHTQNLSTANKTTDKGFLSKTTTQSRFDSQSDTAISSNIEGNKVIMDAGNDVNLTATNAIGDKGTSIKAGNNVNILAAQNTSSKSSESSTKKSGVFSSGGLGFTIGKQKQDNDNTQTALTHTASNIGAIDGNVSIEAGNHIQQTGSNVIAGIGDRQSVDSTDTERGNVVYRAKAVDIDNEMDKYTNQSEQKFKQSGLTVSVSSSLVDSAQNIDRLIDAAGNTSSQRMKGLAAISAGLKAEALYGEGKQAAKALQTGNLKDVGNTRIQATIGSSKSQSNSQSYSEQSQGSSIQAANNLAIIATGAGKDSNININASDITVGNNALFKTDNDLNIKGVAQNEQTRSNNKSSSFGIGAYASTNPGKEGASFGITANASGAKGHANSDGTTYANSHIDVGNTTTLDIGNDMTVKGGVLTTDELTGQVAGDLNMESLQDTYVYDSKQKNAGFSADIDLSGNAQANSLSINGGKTNIDADYAAVTEQTAIYTQKADLNVGGKGRFKGAAFTTASAEDNQSVFAQGIETSDIENRSNYDAKAIAAGISIGKAKDTNPEASLNGIGYGTDSDSQTRTTKAGVTGMAGQAEVTTATKDSLNEPLTNSFNASTVNEELGAQVEITRAFGQEAPKAVAELANKKTQAYKTAQKAVTMLTEDLEDTQDPDKKAYLNQKLQQAKHQLKISEQDYNNWKEGGAYRVAAHTAIGALGAGSLEGALTTGGVAATAPTINDIESKVTDALIAQGMNEQTAKSLSGNLTTLTLARACP
ncbi:two-partner secretion domain-containing protein [Psychrobacter phenylpyruvicus]|uniref:Filamentous hemagglutinin n=1 Tax=Psychrobacter phenylpyruvicus TaxID=29432 RepID=A0A379LJ13_9GAMM|nr:hemagglutinin repeat-containing protein [Psychrobacter phenylpyruvicus]SUD90596.1 Filamentous hemagglutinin [Psychrobacter phenylpyruvicus]